MLRAAVLLRVVLAMVVALVVLVDGYGYAIGRAAVLMAPALAPYRTPLHLALLVGALLVLAGVGVAWTLAGLVGRGETFSAAGLGSLRRLRALLAATAGYLLVCVVGMGVVLDRMALGMPGVWLAGLVGEVALLSTMAAVAHLIRAEAPGYAVAGQQRRPGHPL